MRLTRRLFSMPGSADPFKYFNEPIKYLKDPKLVALKAKRREELREEFHKKKLSPYTYMGDSEGTVFDPAVQRFLSTHAHMEDYFKTTAKSSFFFVAWVVVPILGFAYILKQSKDAEELQIRMGYRAYKDKDWKFE